ncbi:MAG: hypothetical protein ACRCU2_02415 [Planktothrix sp.]
MQIFHLKTTVGGDGVLRVPLPPEYQNQELEAIVIWELLPKFDRFKKPPLKMGFGASLSNKSQLSAQIR